MILMTANGNRSHARCTLLIVSLSVCVSPIVVRLRPALSACLSCFLSVYLLVRSSTRFLNRHLIGPQLAYYHPGRRYYHGYDNYAFRSR